MAEHRILLIEQPAYLRVDLGRLCIERKQQAPSFILPKDIDVLCLHHPAISMSAAILHCLADAGAMVLVTDPRHEPCAMLYPIKSHARQSLRLRSQIKLETADRLPALWQQIVRARIRSQALNLRACGQKGALYLERMVSKVQPGDTNNHEGQASKHYWKHLFETAHRRIKQGATDSINSRLNFGYAVLRAIIARQLAASGLNLCLGIGHCSSENPFNLADDFIEPYRFIVERRVSAMLREHTELPALESADKKHILEFITDRVTLKDGDYRLTSAIEATIDSYCQILQGKGRQLALPIA